jgi:hypothetical protein
MIINCYVGVISFLHSDHTSDHMQINTKVGSSKIHDWDNSIVWLVDKDGVCTFSVQQTHRWFDNSFQSSLQDKFILICSLKVYLGNGSPYTLYTLRIRHKSCQMNNWSTWQMKNRLLVLQIPCNQGNGPSCAILYLESIIMFSNFLSSSNRF